MSKDKEELFFVLDEMSEDDTELHLDKLMKEIEHKQVMKGLNKAFGKLNKHKVERDDMLNRKKA